MSEPCAVCRCLSCVDANEPACIDCKEDHATGDGRCRDCRIQHQLDRMQCQTCKRMRYQADGPLGGLGLYLWGERCACPRAEA